MNTILHATFANADDGIRAVEALLYHGVRAEDINLILPQTQPARAKQAVSPPERVEPTANPRSEQAAKSAFVPVSAATMASNADVPPPPQLPPLPQRHAVRYYNDDDLMAPNALGYRYDALGAVIPDHVKTQGSATADHICHEAVADAEEGAALGLGLGLLTACCIPGIGMIAGAGTIVVGLMAAGAVAGGIAGGICGYLIERGVAREIAQSMSDHLEAGGATLSVPVPDAGKEAEIVRIIEASGGRLIRHA